MQSFTEQMRSFCACARRMGVDSPALTELTGTAASPCTALVTGDFKTGKSTFINAWVGKTMMASRNYVCTNVIATVEFGTNTDTARIVYTDREPVTMSLERFSKEFTLTWEDEQLLENVGRLDRLANVSHVELQSDAPFFADGMRLVDTPGLSERHTPAAKAVSELVFQADAIIFIMSAIRFCTCAEKAYITENFAGRGLCNVFFVINHIDNLIPGELAEIIPYVRSGLAEVFTDRDGNFDEELYSKRVFFTNAYGAECIRTGKPYCPMAGKKSAKAPLELEETGLPEFERAFAAYREECRCRRELTLAAAVYRQALAQLRGGAKWYPNPGHARRGEVPMEADVLLRLCSIREPLCAAFEAVYGYEPSDKELLSGRRQL